MVGHFAERAGLPWGYGIGIGSGTMLGYAGGSWEKGPGADVQKALSDMAAAIMEKRGGQNILVSPKFPRILYKALANLSFWLAAKRNGAGNVRARPYQ